MQGAKSFPPESRHFDVRNEQRPEATQGPPWPPDSHRKAHPPLTQNVATSRGQVFTVAYPQPPIPQVTQAKPEAMSRYQFTLHDLDRCLYGKQEIAVVQIDAPKKEDGNQEDKGKPAKWCDICQEIRFGECPTHGPLPSMRPTMILPGPKTYAISTFPDEVGLCRSSIINADYGVFARHFIPLGTWIGPYEGRKVSVDEGMRLMVHDTPFMWEIYENGRLNHFLNAGDENYSSWMRFIQCARHKGEQNLYVFQYYGSIYYRAFKDIPVGTELLVWYDEKYPQYLGVPLEIKDMSSCTVESIQTPTEVANRSTDEPESAQARPKINRPLIDMAKHPHGVPTTVQLQPGERPHLQPPSFPPPLSQAPGVSMQPRFHAPGNSQPPMDFSPKGFLVAGPPERFTSEQGKRPTQTHTLTYGRDPHSVFPRPEAANEEFMKAMNPSMKHPMPEKAQAFSLPHDKGPIPSPGYGRPQLAVSIYQYPTQGASKPSPHPHGRPINSADNTIRYVAPDSHPNSRSPMPGHGPYVTSSGHATRVSSKEFSPGGPTTIKPKPMPPGMFGPEHLPFPGAAHGVFPAQGQAPMSMPSASGHGSQRMLEMVGRPSIHEKRSPPGTESPGGFRSERPPVSSAYGPPSPKVAILSGAQQSSQTSPVSPPSLILVDRNSQQNTHDENQNEVIRQDPSVNGMKVELKCMQCLQRFNDQAQFNNHICNSDKDKLYQCGRCSLAFQTAHQLDRHILSHTQDRLFRCGLCSISFSGSADLDAHMRMHSNVRALEHADSRKPLETS